MSDFSLSLTDPVGNDTTYAYDGLGRLTIETNEGSQWRSYQYSALGDLTRLRDRNGRVLQFGYDLLGQLTSEEWRSNADPVPSLTIATTTQGGAANEVQRVGVTASFITGGTFTLSYNRATLPAESDVFATELLTMTGPFLFRLDSLLPRARRPKPPNANYQYLEAKNSIDATLSNTEPQRRPCSKA